MNEPTEDVAPKDVGAELWRATSGLAWFGGVELQPTMGSGLVVVLRKSLGWTLEQLAEHAEMHSTYVGSVERGERNLSLINIARLARALGTEELVRGLRP